MFEQRFPVVMRVIEFLPRLSQIPARRLAYFLRVIGDLALQYSLVFPGGFFPFGKIFLEFVVLRLDGFAEHRWLSPEGFSLLAQSALTRKARALLEKTQGRRGSARRGGPRTVA